MALPALCAVLVVATGPDPEVAGPMGERREAMPGLARAELGDRPIVVSPANGIDNQRILPEFFSKVILTFVGYNARRDEPVVVGYRHKGPLLIGTPDNSLQDELRLVQSILARGCPTEITDRLQDAVHSKIVVNLTNALDALIGRGARPLSNLAYLPAITPHPGFVGRRAGRARGRLSRASYRRHAAIRASSFGCGAAGLPDATAVRA